MFRMHMNIIKYLQAQGLGSRKQCQNWVKGGWIEIDGEIVDDTKAEVHLDGRRVLKLDEDNIPTVDLPYFYILLNKAPDTETSHKPQQYPSVFSLLPNNFRDIDIQAVGRLDADTTGAIILTNDGQFNHRVTSPKHHVAKIYRVTLKHAAEQSLCDKLIKGVLLDDEHETIAAAAAELIDPNTLLMTLTQGKYHQVKRMIAAAGNRVEGLHRDQFHQWRVDDFAVGEWRFLDVTEVQASI